LIASNKNLVRDTYGKYSLRIKLGGLSNIV